MAKSQRVGTRGRRNDGGAEPEADLNPGLSWMGDHCNPNVMWFGGRVRLTAKMIAYGGPVS